jgi:hypothetical protein
LAKNVPIAEVKNTIIFIGHRPLRKHFLALGSRGTQLIEFSGIMSLAKGKNQDGN